MSMNALKDPSLAAVKLKLNATERSQKSQLDSLVNKLSPVATPVTIIPK